MKSFFNIKFSFQILRMKKDGDWYIKALTTLVEKKTNIFKPSIHYVVYC